MDENSDDKVVLITGCSSGIGLESAALCARKGHTVYAAVRNVAGSHNLRSIKEEEKLGNLKILQMDVSSDISVENGLSHIIQECGKIDVLFNNAGFMIMGSLEDLTMNEIQRQIDTDLMGPMRLAKNVIPHMRAHKKGLIINMSSIAGKVGFQLSSAYCVSKFGIEGLTESLRRELQSRDINVCMIEAGIVNTKFFENMKRAKMSHGSIYAKETQEMESVINEIKKEKWTDPTDVAALVARLIEEENVECRYVVGTDAEYLIDGFYHNKNDCKKMDNIIQEIMAKYLDER